MATPDASVLWQIGSPTGRTPRGASSEFLQSGRWQPVFDYHVGEDADPVRCPRLPRILTVTGGRRKYAGSTGKINIHFTLDHSYAAGELIFTYDRYGSERNQIYFDGALLATIRGAGEGRLTHSEIPLDSVCEGKHTLTIIAIRGAGDQGHHVDYFKLTYIPPEEPEEPAVPDVEISYINFDGVVARVESDEYVEITNHGTGPADLSGWRLYADDHGQNFTFPSGTRLEPDATVIQEKNPGFETRVV